MAREATEASEAVGLPAEEEELGALRLLCSSLARLFTYPDRETAAVFTDEESVLFLDGLVRRAHIDDGSLRGPVAACLLEAASAPDARADAMRRTFSRLFFAPCSPLSLEGRRWARRDPADPEARLGEAASVAQCYRTSGLVLRSGVTERPDALPTELDYLAFLLVRELRSGREGNGAQALMWKRRRILFVERHTSFLARAVERGVGECTSWPFLLYWVALLGRTVARCAL